ncbi:MAG TPA: thioredoxin domain-containing protein, partial [Bryobacteraceae bacterium]|nr:thioredoxin domain-containing protein [Bryobacteraceae bacterium]
LGGLVFALLTPLAIAESGHPWLDKQLTKQRYGCPPGNSPVRGPADAPVTITEFADYDCPYCRDDEAVVKKVLAAYPSQVRLVFKNLPLDMHAKAKQKALTAVCMGNQGKFWKAHDELLAGEPPNKVTAGADKNRLNACVSQAGEEQVQSDVALAKKLGLATTPSFVVDGIRIGGALGFDQFKLLVDAELARKGAAK